MNTNDSRTPAASPSDAVIETPFGQYPKDAWDAFEKHRAEQGRILGMPGLNARPCFMAGWNARSALSQPQAEPDMRAICEALGFDPTNHHNAAKCPYCRPAEPAAGEQAGAVASEYDNLTCYEEMERRSRKYWAEFDALAAPGAAIAAREEAPAAPQAGTGHKSCRMDDGRCGICGGDWSVCGCEGMLRRASTPGPDDTPLETGEGDAHGR